MTFSGIWLIAGMVAVPAAAVDDVAGIVALGGRCDRDAAGEVVGVDLAHAWLTDADLARLARFPRLERIDLSYTKVTDLGLEHLAPLTRVKALNLRYAESVSDVGIAHLKHWRDLEFLDLRGTKVSSTVFEYIAPMTRLRSLDVGHSRVNDDLFEALDGLQHLEHFAFGGNKMSGAALPLLKTLPGLRSLSVSGQQRTDSGLWSVAVTDFNIGHIAGLRPLEVLDLGQTNLTDRGVAQLARLTNLQTLDLSGTRVTGKGLAPLAELPRLRHLKLGKARGVDDQALPTLLRMERLEILELPETSVTARGLARLAAKPGLKQLFVGGLDLSPEDLNALTAAMPECRISWWRKPAIASPETDRRGGN